ncbi:MAG: pilus assembly protein CpaE [Jatrophihabitans sp.]
MTATGCLAASDRRLVGCSPPAERTCTTGLVISIETARALRESGLRWKPASGDRFVVIDRGMDAEVFVLSEMTVEVHRLGDRQVIGFNGTTEWALDSVDDQDAVWLPRESQLRELLASTFRSLRRIDGQWQVDLEVNGAPAGYRHPDAEQAYALALLGLVAGEA